LLLSFVEDAELIYRECGYGSVDEYIRNGLELDPEQVRWAIDGLRRMKPDDPIPYARAMELGKHGGPREGAGRPKKGEEQETKNQVANRHSKTSELSSTSRVRILARLDRDGHAELAAKVRAGKLSANKAAIEAGFGKPSPTPAESILKHLPKLTPAQLRHVRARIDELLNHKRRAA
jgi:Arc/MetJ-type ribon-helix-helix transcriptional regulator